MSVLTTTALKAAPPAAAGASVTSALMPTWGAWVEVITTTAAPVSIAGVELGGGTYSSKDYELDLGTGASGAEVSLGTLRLFLWSSGTVQTPSGVLLPVPLGGIPAGVRVAVRARSGPVSPAGPATITLLYYESLSATQVTTSTQPLSAAPLGTTSPNLVPSATPWANSPWVELLTAAPAPIGLAGLVHSCRLAPDAVEFDLGTGGSGSETVLTTLRTAQQVGTRFPHSWLPGLYPVATGTRISARMRTSGTATTAYPVSLVYYTNVP